MKVLGRFAFLLAVLGLWSCESSASKSELFEKSLSWYTWKAEGLEQKMTPQGLFLPSATGVQRPDLWWIRGTTEVNSKALLIQGYPLRFYSIYEHSFGLSLDPLPMEWDLNDYHILEALTWKQGFLIFVKQEGSWDVMDEQPPLAVLKWEPGLESWSYVPLSTQISNPTMKLISVEPLQSTFLLVFSTPSGKQQSILWNPESGSEESVEKMDQLPTDPRLRVPFLRLLKNSQADYAWSTKGALSRVSDQTDWDVLIFPLRPEISNWTGSASLLKGSLVSFETSSGIPGLVYVPHLLFSVQP